MTLSDVLERKRKKEKKSMTIYDVLKQDVQVLESLRIPTCETDLWNAIQIVLHNEKICIEAMEKQQKQQENKAEDKTEDTEEVDQPEG